jgi:hypothetical protein
MEEVWKDIPGYEGMYQVSNMGRVRSLDRYITRNGAPAKITGRILRHKYGKDEYERTSLCKESKVESVIVHRLVAQAFIENPEAKITVNHINGNKHDNRAVNLEWNTYAENNSHAAENGLNKMTEKNNKCSKQVAQYDLTMNLIKTYPSIKEAERQTGVANQSIVTCCQGRFKTAGGYIWKYA